MAEPALHVRCTLGCILSFFSMLYFLYFVLNIYSIERYTFWFVSITIEFYVYLAFRSHYMYTYQLETFFLKHA